MKVCIKCMVTKAPAEFYPQPGTKDNLRAACKECGKAATNAWRIANLEKHNAANLAWARANPEKRKVSTTKWELANAEKDRAARAKWRRENKEARAATRAVWARANLGKVNATTAKRHAAKMKAVPKWASKFIIEEAYSLAALRTKVMGFKWHVDHIVPLQHKLVCGLHCEANLQVIPARDNIIKGNRYWPDMPEQSA